MDIIRIYFDKSLQGRAYEVQEIFYNHVYLDTVFIDISTTCADIYTAMEGKWHVTWYKEDSIYSLTYTCIKSAYYIIYNI